MYVAVDVGGTKTLLASLSPEGEVLQTLKFATPDNYPDFLEDLASQAAILLKRSGAHPAAVAAAVPGRIDRKHGVGLDFGNLPWTDVPVKHDLERIFNCPVLLENDANLAGLSEAINVRNEFNKVLYITISTGIGTGIITDGIIDPDFADSESGQMLLEHEGKMRTWESFASGSAIVQRFGKRAADITDEATWRILVHDFSLGILSLLATLQPDVIIIGGGVGSHFDRFGDLLIEELERFSSPLVPIPPIHEARHAEEAVIYGCYELLKANHASAAS